MAVSYTNTINVNDDRAADRDGAAEGTHFYGQALSRMAIKAKLLYQI